MTSSINPLLPAAIKAYTADVRANFLAAFNEISALQAGVASLEVNIQNFLTPSQLIDVRAGNLTFDASVPIQAAIDFASALAGFSSTRSSVLVRLIAGRYGVTNQVLGKIHTRLVCDGLIYNQLVSTTTPCILFKSGSHCANITVDANGQTGIQFGENGATCDMIIGDVRVLNAGVAANQYGVRFVGDGFVFGSVHVDKGTVGVDFGDGGSNSCKNVHGDYVRSFNAVTGVRANLCQGVKISQWDLDSSSLIGAQIDSVHDFTLPDVTVFFNDATAGGAFTSGYGMKVGTSSSGDLVTAFKMGLMADNCGGTALKIDYIKESEIWLNANAGHLLTGDTHPIVNALEYGANVNSLFAAHLYVGGALITQTVGTVVGFADYYDGTNYTLIPGSGSLIIARLKLGSASNTALIGYQSLFQLNDQSLTTQTVLQNSNVFSFLVAANEWWTVDMMLDIGALLSTTGIKLSVTVPAAGALFNAVASLVPDVYAAANTGAKRITASGTTMDFTAATQVGVLNAVARVSVMVQNGANAGSIVLQFAQSTSNAGAITIRKGSYGTANRFG